MTELLNKFVRRCIDVFKENLCGVYLHGSAVMGCFNPVKSDIDLIVIVYDKISDAEKREFMNSVVDLNSIAPPKGIEMSVVKKAVCDPFVYPTPYELHFSAGYIDWYGEDPEDYIKEMNGTDKDLAAHFNVIRKRGERLYGLPVTEVFGEVPKAAYLDSIWFDVEDAREDIKENPPYIILNLPRVLAFCREGSVLSKKEGGEWALMNLPAKYHPLIQNALNEYIKNENVLYDADLSDNYAEYVIKQIKELL